MKYICETIKGYFKSNLKAYLNRYFGASLDDLNRDIANEYEYLRKLKEKRNRVIIELGG